jgi:hypothetical protein
MLKDKGSQSIEFKLAAKVKTIIASVNMVDVKVTIRSKTNEEKMFKYQEPRKNKSIADWELEEKLNRFMVETTQHMQVINSPLELAALAIGEWTTNWVGMPSSTKLVDLTKFQEVPSNFPSKTISVEEIFQDIRKNMLETNYTLNLGQLIKITIDLKIYLW